MPQPLTPSAASAQASPLPASTKAPPPRRLWTIAAGLLVVLSTGGVVALLSTSSEPSPTSAASRETDPARQTFGPPAPEANLAPATPSTDIQASRSGEHARSIPATVTPRPLTSAESREPGPATNTARRPSDPADQKDRPSAVPRPQYRFFHPREDKVYLAAITECQQNLAASRADVLATLDALRAVKPSADLTLQRQQLLRYGVPPWDVKLKEESSRFAAACSSALEQCIRTIDDGRHPQSVDRLRRELNYYMNYTLVGEWKNGDELVVVAYDKGAGAWRLTMEAAGGTAYGEQINLNGSEFSFTIARGIGREVLPTGAKFKLTIRDGKAHLVGKGVSSRLTQSIALLNPSVG